MVIYMLRCIVGGDRKIAMDLAFKKNPFSPVFCFLQRTPNIKSYVRAFWLWILWQDVIGAAETGSGKTLAFGLPILQRLLEEQEKASRSLQNEERSLETVKGGPLRALIITPTRELALQV